MKKQTRSEISESLSPGDLGKMEEEDEEGGVSPPRAPAGLGETGLPPASGTHQAPFLADSRFVAD